MLARLLTSFFIWTLVVVPAQLLSVPVVSLLLLTTWDGRSTIFGNAKWGKGELNPAYMESGYWAALVWLCWRNPVNNLMSFALAAKYGPHHTVGDENIGDKIAGGSYLIERLSGFPVWEYYLVKPYGKRCLRVRIGWKMDGVIAGSFPFVFTVNPIHAYSGK